MKALTRRDFIRSIAAAGGAAVVDQILVACGIKTELPPPGQSSFPSPISTPSGIKPTQPVQHLSTTSTSPTAPSPATGLSPTAGESLDPPPLLVSSATPAGLPDLVVARGGTPEDMVRKALAALGGIEKYVYPGAKVIIKPNICVAYHTYEFAATTNPWVVGSLVKLCLEAGAASVRVMDAPFGGTAKEAYARSGIEAEVKAAGGEMAYMPGFKYVSTEIPRGIDLRQTDLFDEILKADVLINVPIAKHHSLARLTLGMKNLMGVIRDRQAMHRNLGQRLADLASLVTPTLTVVDAVRILVEHGPTGGSLSDVKQLDTLIVSTDLVAADSFAATLFGIQPNDISYIQAAASLGLGRSDLNSLRIEEISVNA